MLDTLRRERQGRRGRSDIGPVDHIFELVDTKEAIALEETGGLRPRSRRGGHDPDPGGPPAVVVGLDTITGLQTARILAARGVPVVGRGRRPPALRLPDARVPRGRAGGLRSEALVDALVPSAERLDRPGRPRSPARTSPSWRSRGTGSGSPGVPRRAARPRRRRDAHGQGRLRRARAGARPADPGDGDPRDRADAERAARDAGLPGGAQARRSSRRPGRPAPAPRRFQVADAGRAARGLRPGGAPGPTSLIAQEWIAGGGGRPLLGATPTSTGPRAAGHVRRPEAPAVAAAHRDEQPGRGDAATTRSSGDAAAVRGRRLPRARLRRDEAGRAHRPAPHHRAEHRPADGPLGHRRGAAASNCSCRPTATRSASRCPRPSPSATAASSGSTGVTTSRRPSCGSPVAAS